MTAASETVKGIVFNIQRYALHDGPGIRTTVFLKGCPLACAWCHNPEGIKAKAEITWADDRCLVCGVCREACPYGDHDNKKGAWPVGLESCSLCGGCVEACPSGARTLTGESLSVDQVIQRVWADRAFYEESGGGVTFSGGEPLMQSGFLLALLERCRALGIHAAVDTSGLAPTTVVDQVAQLADLFLYDVKLMDEEEHRRFTGASNKLILVNLHRLVQSGAMVWLRVPLIPGVNDHRENLEATARLACELGRVRQIHLLPYHALGRHKFRRMGQSYPLAQLAPPSPEHLERARVVFADAGLDVRLGG